MRDERGFTLIEVLASLVIISIVLTSFMAIFSNTNAQAVSNSEKLVVINLADAYLERVKVDPVDTIKTESIKPDKTITEYIKFDTCPVIDQVKRCEDRILQNKYTTLNSKAYKVKIEFNQSQVRPPSPPDSPILYSEKELKLINVVVTVTSPTSNLSSSVEGYISYE